MRLTARQERFIRFHDEAPFPHKWEWLGGATPKERNRLRAWKFRPAPYYGRRQCTLSGSEFAAVRDSGLIDSQFRTTDAGREALRAHPGGGGSDG